MVLFGKCGVDFVAHLPRWPYNTPVKVACPFTAQSGARRRGTREAHDREESIAANVPVSDDLHRLLGAW